MLDARRLLPELVLGIAALAAGFTGATWSASPFVVRALVADRVADLAPRRVDEAPQNAKLLERERVRFRTNSRDVLLALGAGFVAAALARLLGRRDPLRGLPIRGPLLGALLLAGAEVVSQAGLLARAVADGAATEGESERRLRFFDQAAAAAERLNRATPPDAQLLVIDFADPQDVAKIGYLVFPRRIFLHPDSTWHSDAATARRMLAEQPDWRDQIIGAGYQFAVDLRRLVEGRDDAIIPLLERPDG